MDEKIMIESVDGRDMITLYNDRSILIQTDYGDRHMALGQFSEEALAELGRACITEGTTAPIPFKTDAAFEDVQVGDRVRVTNLDGDCLEYTVGWVNAHMFLSESESVVTMEADKDYTIDILYRPEPPEPTLPTEDGSFVEADGELYTRWGPDRWHKVGRMNFAATDWEMAQKDWKPATVIWSTK